MAYVNGTTHYNLPQTVGTDKRDWADTNEAFAAIDTALYSAVDDVAAAGTEITALKGRMTTAETNIGQNTSDIAGLDTRLTTAEGAITSQQSQITDTRQDLEDMICAYNEATATSTHAYAIGDYFIYNDVLYKATQAIAIGDTIVPDTNCSTTNVTTELLATEDLSGDVQQLQTDVASAQQDIQNIETAVEDITSMNHVDATTLTNLQAALSSFNSVLDSLTPDKLIKSFVVIKDSGIESGVYRCTLANSNTCGFSLTRAIYASNVPVLLTVSFEHALNSTSLWVGLETYMQVNPYSAVVNDIPNLTLSSGASVTLYYPN